MAEEEKSIEELRSEAIKGLLNRVIRSTNSHGTDAAKIRDLAHAVAYLEGTTVRG